MYCAYGYSIIAMIPAMIQYHCGSLLGVSLGGGDTTSNKYKLEVIVTPPHVLPIYCKEGL